MKPTDIVKQCEERAKKYHLKASDLLYGDKLYEEIFSEKYNKKNVALHNNP